MVPPNLLIGGGGAVHSLRPRAPPHMYFCMNLATDNVGQQPTSARVWLGLTADNDNVGRGRQPRPTTMTGRLART